MTKTEAIEVLKELKQPTKPFIKVGDDEKAIDMAIEALKQEPRKKGKWKRRIVDSGYNANWICSECGYKEMTDFPTHFCPNCGAEMREK